MKIIKTIAVKEWRGWWGQPTGYIFAGLLLLVSNWLFFNDLFVLGQADARPLYGTMGLLLAMFVPAVTMGLMADEKRSGTWEVLLTQPVNEWQVVAGKFLGIGIYLLSVVAMMSPAVVTVYLLGRPDYGPLLGGFLTTVLLAWGYLAWGLLVSSLTSQPIVAFMVAAIGLVANSLLAQETFLLRIPGQWRELVAGLSLSFRAERMSSGLIELDNLLFFASWMMIFLILTVIVIKNRGK